MLQPMVDEIRLKEAWELAEKVHKDQKRFDGSPYINHIKDCVKILEEIGLKTERTELLAILHDVFEDSVNAVKPPVEHDDYHRLLLLTHKGGLATYQAYIDKIIMSKDRDVIAVKVADMIQNLTESPKKKQREKYRIALPKLINALIDSIVTKLERSVKDYYDY